jgi:hypothetical protein
MQIRNRLFGVVLTSALLAAGLAGVAAPAQAATPVTAVTPSAAFANDPHDPLASSLAKPPSAPPKIFKTLPSPKGVKISKKAPPAASGGMSTFSTCPVACYYYNVGSQGFASAPFPTGDYANFSVNTPSVPVLNSTDYHTLAEAAVQKTTSNGLQQTIELGWTIDNQGVNGADHTNPHIFLGWWKNGVFTCYNGCGWVPYAGATYTIGQLIPGTTTALKFGWQYDSGNWWGWVSNTAGTVGGWIGYLPGTLWTSNNTYGTAVTGFSDADLVQNFGEIAANNTPASTDCTDMGSQTLATTTAGASIGSVSYPNIAVGSVNVYWHESPAGIQPYWNAESLSTRTMRYGGPGGC